MRKQLLIACLFSLPLLAKAQKTGTVTGHVVYAGSNLPVRNARVTLEPVPVPGASVPKKDDENSVEGLHTIVETLPDGSFRFPSVRPGSYYVLADKLGCLSPLGQITRADLERPTDQSLARMAELLAGVTVAANKTADVSILLHPGAAIAGTVRFDDGSPDAGARVQLMTRNTKGAWAEFRTTAMGSYNGDARTDDRGNYRISGLPAGEYLLRTPLEITEVQANYIFGSSGSSSNREVFKLYVFQNDSFRPADATPVKLAQGEDSEAQTITVPIARLHSLSGSLAEQGTGHIINAGRVELFFPGTEDILSSTEVSSADSQFHFLYIPEGTYSLRVDDARDVTRTEVAYPKGTMPPTHTEEKTVKTYGKAAQTMVINGDQTAVILAVPALDKN